MITWQKTLQEKPSQPESYMDLVDIIDQPEGLHKINTILFSV